MPTNPRRFALNFQNIFIAMHIDGPGHEILGPELVSAFSRGGELTVPQTTEALNLLDDDLDRSPGAGAFAWDALRIPNGTFQFRAPGYGDIDIQIHTVQRGNLRGRRVVKVRDETGPGGWRAIAFVGRHGNFQLWTRYLSQASEPYTIAARAVTEALWHSRGEGGSFNVPSFAISEVPVQARISITRRSCNICNESIYSDRVSPSGSTRGMVTNLYCDNHLPAVPEPTRRVIPAVDREAELARIREENAANAPAEPQRASRGRSEAVYGDDTFSVRRYNPLVLCEITGTEIQ